MTGGFRGDGFVWYDIFEFRTKVREPVRVPDVVYVREYGKEKVKIDVWNPYLCPEWEAIRISAELKTQLALSVGIASAGGLLAIAGIQLMSARSMTMGF